MDLEEDAKKIRNLFPKLVEIRPPNEKSNCHGFLFDQGRTWIGDPLKFLAGYCFVGDYKVGGGVAVHRGDIVLYCKDGQITHSARVIQIDDSGSVLVHSKWGALGAYAHDICDVPDGSYGLTDFGFPVIYSKRKAARYSPSKKGRNVAFRMRSIPETNN